VVAKRSCLVWDVVAKRGNSTYKIGTWSLKY
jgi:hypothetical protein